MTLDNLQTKSEFEQSIARFEWLLIEVAAVFLAFGTFTSAIIDNDRRLNWSSRCRNEGK